MSLKPFTYPFPETRFLHSGSNVYKFKIRYGNRVRREDVENKEVIIQELEDSVRVVLGNLDNLQPFTTKHFIVFPYKSRWERVSHLKFKHGEIALVPYPFVLTLYVEMKWFHENLSAGKPINDSALGLVLTEREAAGAMRKKRKRTEVSSSPSRPGLDRAKMRTSSQGSSKKKLLMETSRKNSQDFRRTESTKTYLDGLQPLAVEFFTSKTAQGTPQHRWVVGPSGSAQNKERKTQQECQETPAFGVADVQEQDSRWEDSQAGDIIPSGQQSSPSPPGRADLGTSGFFAFLSSLFPFRYFFRRSSQ